MKKTLMLLAVWLLLAGLAWAEDPPGLAAVRQAAENGNPEAQLEIGVLYEYGFFMPENKVPALAWYMAAADQGNEKAIKYRDRLMSSMTQAQIDEARRQRDRLAGGDTPTTQPPAAPEPPSEAH